MPAADNRQPTPDDLTIDELAERTGMTVRNLREWRTLGLLPLAEKRGRIGFYPPAVVDRVERIQKLHAEGFTLELIGRMLDTGGEAGDEVMRLAETLSAPLLRDPVSLEEIAASLQEIGLSTEAIRDSTAEITAHAEGIAEIFERVWLDQIWEPFVEAGMPEDDLPRIQEAAARVQPLALDAVVAVFTVAMEAQIEKGIARELGLVTERDVKST
jgi:DNA-binding transcriptional MerR regulator